MKYAESVKIFLPKEEGFWSFSCDNHIFEEIIAYLSLNIRYAIHYGLSVRVDLENREVIGRAYAAISLQAVPSHAYPSFNTKNSYYITTQEYMLGLNLADLDTLVTKVGGYIQVTSAGKNGVKSTIYLPRIV